MLMVVQSSTFQIPVTYQQYQFMFILELCCLSNYVLLLIVACLKSIYSVALVQCEIFSRDVSCCLLSVMHVSG